MTEPSEALKPCPFCGGEAGRAWETAKVPAAAVCMTNGCGAEILKDTLAEAITAWNTRAMVAGEPVAWMYERPWPDDMPKQEVRVERWATDVGRYYGWTETPLYTHPAPDTAALLEALQLWLDYDNQDEADFANVGPMLLYAKAIETTRALIAQHKGTEHG